MTAADALLEAANDVVRCAQARDARGMTTALSAVKHWASVLYGEANKIAAETSPFQPGARVRLAAEYAEDDHELPAGEVIERISPMGLNEGDFLVQWDTAFVERRRREHRERVLKSGGTEEDAKKNEPTGTEWISPEMVELIT